MDGDGINSNLVASTRDDPLSKKICSLCNYIKSDIFAADFKWSLFVGASHSYRFDTCLHPYPPQFVHDGHKDIEKLREVMTHMPSLPTLLSVLEESCSDFSNREPLIDLLHWVFIEQNDPLLETVSQEEFSNVISKVCGECNVIPHFIFKVNHKLKIENQKRFQEAVKKHGSIFLYHGSRLENFYSILNYGLLTNLNKKCVYGQGIYLSSELMVSLIYSQKTFGWGGSIIGSQLSCLALCEVINHPDVKGQMSDTDTNPSRSLAEDSACGPVPMKHFLVQNNELVQVQYVLVYAESPHSINSQDSSKNSMLGWLCKHKLLTLMVGYVVLLSAVGMSNNPTVMRYYRMFLRRWNH